MMHPVVYVVAILVSYISQTQAIMNETEIRNLGKKCNATESDLNKALKYEVPDTSNGKCLMLCFLKEVQTLNEDGEFIEDVVYQSLIAYWPEISRDNLKKIARHCAEKMVSFANKKDTCEYGYQSIYCINQEFAQDNLLPIPTTPSPSSTS